MRSKGMNSVNMSLWSLKRMALYCCISPSNRCHLSSLNSAPFINQSVFPIPFSSAWVWSMWSRWLLLLGDSLEQGPHLGFHWWPCSCKHRRGCHGTLPASGGRWMEPATLAGVSMTLLCWWCFGSEEPHFQSPPLLRQCLQSPPLVF